MKHRYMRFVYICLSTCKINVWELYFKRPNLRLIDTCVEASVCSVPEVTEVEWLSI